MAKFFGLDATNGIATTPAAATELTISSGAVTVTGTGLGFRIDTESDASSDDLDTINGGGVGSVIFVRSEHTDRTVVLKHNTGNILISSGEDYTLDSTSEMVVLFYDSGLSKWIAPNVVPASGGSSDFAYICNRQTAANQGGGVTSGDWRTCVLNTEDADTGNNVSLASNVLTVESGTYRVHFFQRLYYVEHCQVRLRDVDNNVDLGLAGAGLANDVSNMNDGLQVGWGRFTLSAQTDIELQARVSVTNGSNGLGLNGYDWSSSVDLAGVVLWKE